VIKKEAVIRLAIAAANDSEWGYNSAVALEYLKEIDPDYDWEPELFQAELEAGYREMGPRLPPSEMELAMLEMYEPYVLALLKSSPLVEFLNKTTEDIPVSGGKSFVIPLEIKK
jgi:hypothetical protein